MGAFLRPTAIIFLFGSYLLQFLDLDECSVEH